MICQSWFIARDVVGNLSHGWAIGIDGVDGTALGQVEAMECERSNVGGRGRVESTEAAILLWHDRATVENAFDEPVVHHERRDDQLKDTARQRIFEPRDRKDVDTFVGQASAGALHRLCAPIDSRQRRPRLSSEHALSRLADADAELEHAPRVDSLRRAGDRILELVVSRELGADLGHVLVRVEVELRHAVTRSRRRRAPKHDEPHRSARRRHFGGDGHGVVRFTCNERRWESRPCASASATAVALSLQPS
jgi:hypothetical protein